MPTCPCNVDILYADAYVAACRNFAGYVRSCIADLDTPRVERTNISSGRTGASFQKLPKPDRNTTICLNPGQKVQKIVDFVVWICFAFTCVSFFFFFLVCVCVWCLCGCLGVFVCVFVCVVFGRQKRFHAFNKKRLKCQRYDPCLMQQRNACQWLSESCATDCLANGAKSCRSCRRFGEVPDLSRSQILRFRANFESVTRV